MTRVIISGGGTGGHVFPAIAIANAIRKREPDADILFIGAKGKLEMEKVPAAGYPIEGLWISGLQRRLTVKNLSFPFKVLSSLFKAGTIIRKFRPHAVVGVGGYASGPTLRVASRRGIPTLIQEQNSYPGITNKLLGTRVSRICVAYEGMDRFFPKEKLILTGNPVRQDLLHTGSLKSEGLSYYNLKPDRLTVLVVGGSLGAATINAAVKACVLENITGQSVQLLWQTGRYYYDAYRNDPMVAQAPNVHLLPFIDRMDLAYGAADLIISRAGAIAISELCIVGKPVILIPSPNVAEDHQTKNARALAERDAAILLRDAEAVAQLPKLLAALSTDVHRQHTLKKNIAGLALPDAADRIADEVLHLISQLT